MPFKRVFTTTGAGYGAIVLLRCDHSFRTPPIWAMTLTPARTLKLSAFRTFKKGPHKTRDRRCTRAASLRTEHNPTRVTFRPHHDTPRREYAGGVSQSGKVGEPG